MTICTKNNENKHVLIIFDDCLHDTNIKNSKSLAIIFTTGRHINKSTFVACQLPVCRTNSDLILMGNFDNIVSSWFQIIIKLTFRMKSQLSKNLDFSIK